MLEGVEIAVGTIMNVADEIEGVEVVVEAVVGIGVGVWVDTSGGKFGYGVA